MSNPNLQNKTKEIACQGQIFVSFLTRVLIGFPINAPYKSQSKNKLWCRQTDNYADNLCGVAVVIVGKCNNTKQKQISCNTFVCKEWSYSVNTDEL